MSKGGWACPVCTFFNPPAQLQSCEMCSSPNPAEAAIEASPENEFTKVCKQAMVDKYIFWEDVGTALQHALATKETEAAHGFLVECLEEILTIVTNQDFFPQAPKPVLSNICCMAAELCGYELQERNSTQLMAACNTLFDTGRKYWGSLPVVSYFTWTRAIFVPDPALFSLRTLRHLVTFSSIQVTLKPFLVSTHDTHF